MYRASCAALVIAVSLAQQSSGQVIVDEDFNYADQAAFEAAWNPDIGAGIFDITGLGTAGRLVPDPNNPLIVPPNDDPPGIDDKAVAMDVLINEYKTPFEITPTATHAVRFGGDIFDDVSGNKKFTIGLRNDTIERSAGLFGTNFFELGFFNGLTYDPADPQNTPPAIPTFDQTVTDFAYRVALVGDPDPNDNPVREPNWQQFLLDTSLDVATPNVADPHNPLPVPDGVVSSADIGQGWHRWEATIRLESVTLKLDLFRDGVKNLTRDPNSGELLEGVGNTGFDATVTWNIGLSDLEPNDAFDVDPFTSLRIGAPSGVGGGLTQATVDNVILQLVVPEPSTPVLCAVTVLLSAIRFRRR